MKSRLIHGKAFAGTSASNSIVGQDCSVCQQAFQENDVVTYVRRRLHVFHWYCFEQWVATRVRDAVTGGSDNIEVTCPEHRTTVAHDGDYIFGIVTSGKQQSLEPEATHPYAFSWNYRHYCPSIEGFGEPHNFRSVLHRLTLEDFRERASLNAINIVNEARTGRRVHSNGPALLHYFDPPNVATVQGFLEDINRYLRCLHRPFLSLDISLEDFWGWVLRNIDVLSLPDGGDDRYYLSMVRQAFEDKPQQPYYDLIQIRQYTSRDFAEFTTQILHSQQWHLFISTILLQMLVCDRMVPLLFPLLTQLNEALVARDLSRVRTVCAQIATHTDNR